MGKAAVEVSAWPAIDLPQVHVGIVVDVAEDQLHRDVLGGRPRAQAAALDRVRVGQHVVEYGLLMAASVLLATDSGGLQEEGAALNVPVAVLRNVTERPEGVEAGVLKLAGNDPATLEGVLNDLLRDETQLRTMREARNPYGDGQAADRIAQAIAWHYGLAERPADWS